MKSIGGFFEKFNNRFVKEVQNLVFISQAIKKYTGIVIEPKDLTISKGIVRVKVSALQKNEIFMKKNRILKELEGKLQALKVTDIQ